MSRGKIIVMMMFSLMVIVALELTVFELVSKAEAQTMKPIQRAYHGQRGPRRPHPARAGPGPILQGVQLPRPRDDRREFRRLR